MKDSCAGCGFQSLGFAGGLEDEASGLVRFGARDYEPALGRWVSKDPIGLNGGRANLYAYAGNMPTTLIDPTGLFDVNCIHRLLDALGVVDPTGAADGVNAAIYLAQGQGWDAGISLLGLVPFWGDLAKGGRLGAAAARGAVTGAENAANAARLSKQLASEEGVAELLSGGGKVIAGPGADAPIRDVGRLMNQYGGTAADWVKVTSTAPGHLQTRAYRNLVTGDVVELKSIIP